MVIDAPGNSCATINTPSFTLKDHSTDLITNKYFHSPQSKTKLDLLPANWYSMPPSPPSL